MKKQYEDHKDDDAPLCMFGVTLEGHCGYDNAVTPYNVHLESDAKEVDPSVDEYLNRIKDADTEIKELLEYFEKQDDDIVVLFYGDHQPPLNDGFYEALYGKEFETLEEKMMLYKVPFFVWANYDIKEENVECTSLNYLTNYLLKAAGLESNYNRFLNDMQQVIPAINAYGYYSNSQGEFIKIEDAEDEEAEYIQQYYELEYNSIFDKGHANPFFFPTP